MSMSMMLLAPAVRRAISRRTTPEPPPTSRITSSGRIWTKSKTVRTRPRYVERPRASRVPTTDLGPTAEGSVKLLADLPDASSHLLRGFECHPWSDVIVERGSEIGHDM